MKILPWLAEMGLDALELQMTYGPRTKPETCIELRKYAEDANIVLSVHASYFIVFTSDNPQKLAQSSETLKRTYDLADKLGANVVVLHPGPLYGGTEAVAIDRFSESARRCLGEIGRTDIGLFVETAGKVGQLGSTDDILEICRRLEGVYPCVDFGHVHARTLGTLETAESVNALVMKLKTFLAECDGPRIHFHFTPIHYGPRGEIQHRAVSDRYPDTTQLGLFEKGPVGSGSQDGWFHPRAQAVAEALRMIDVPCTIISETHNSQEIGALELKRYFRPAC